jgi:hypothetical protein
LAQINLEKGIQVCSNEGECPSPRRDNSKKVKMLRKFLKIFFRTSWPNSIKLGTNYSLVKENSSSNKGPGPLLKEDNHKNVECRLLYNAQGNVEDLH